MRRETLSRARWRRASQTERSEARKGETSVRRERIKRGDFERSADTLSADWVGGRSARVSETPRRGLEVGWGASLSSVSSCEEWVSTRMQAGMATNGREWNEPMALSAFFGG